MSRNMQQRDLSHTYSQQQLRAQPQQWSSGQVQRNGPLNNNSGGGSSSAEWRRYSAWNDDSRADLRQWSEIVTATLSAQQEFDDARRSRTTPVSVLCAHADTRTCAYRVYLSNVGAIRAELFDVVRQCFPGCELRNVEHTSGGGGGAPEMPDYLIAGRSYSYVEIPDSAREALRDAIPALRDSAASAADASDAEEAASTSDGSDESPEMDRRRRAANAAADARKRTRDSYDPIYTAAAITTGALHNSDDGKAHRGRSALDASASRERNAPQRQQQQQQQQQRALANQGVMGFVPGVVDRVTEPIRRRVRAVRNRTGPLQGLVVGAGGTLASGALLASHWYGFSQPWMGAYAVAANAVSYLI